MTGPSELSETSASLPGATVKAAIAPNESKKKKRRPVNKCFSGCAKCKELKVKCDETKPRCQRCVKKGFVCPGFPVQPKLRWSSKHELQTIRSRERTKKSHERRAARSPGLGSQGEAGDLNYSTGQDEATGSTLRPAHKSATEPILHKNTTILRPEADDGSSTELTGNGEGSFSFFLGLWDAHSEQNLATALPRPGMGSSQFESNATLRGPDVSNFEPPYLGLDFEQLPFEDESLIFPEWNPCENTDSAAVSREPQGSGETERDSEIKILELHGHSPSSASPTSSISSTSSGLSVDDRRSVLSPIASNLMDPQDKLVHVYFTFVCPRFSTFDSEQNLFRTFVRNKWQHSSAMFYTMLSMAAGKLGDTTVNYKKAAVEYQTLALQELSSNLAAAPSWTSEHLFIILMLGLSACWHEIQDLGIVHLKALHQAISKNAVDMSDMPGAQEFFFDALVYWGMVTGYFTDTSGNNPTSSLIDFEDLEEARTHVTSDKDSQPSVPKVGIVRTSPHPWTSIASPQQKIFTRITSLIKQVRSFDGQGSRGFTPFVSQPTDFLVMLDDLEEELWSLKLPYLHEIANTGDENTPAIHHLLIAEAYMFANLYQLYSVFPNLARRRSYRLRDSENCAPRSWAEGQIPSWTSVLGANPDYEKWLTFLGRSIIMRLEQIHPASGTSCLHPLLLLIGSTALSVHPEHAGTEDEQDILRTRQFVLDRMEGFSKQYMSERVRRATSVIKEIFKRLDIGVKVLWMDVMQSMGVITVLG